MMNKLLILCMLGMNSYVLSTIDINLPEMQYIADHLSLEECRRLVAALHDPGYDITTNLDLAERKVPEDVPCLNMLLHWNTAKGEGRGKTHSTLSHRLKQMKRQDLADWLSKTVFHELAQDLQRSFLEGALQNLAEPYNASEIYRPNRNPLNDVGKIDTTDDWTLLDTICFTLVLILASVTVFLLVQVTWRHVFECHHFKRTGDKKAALSTFRYFRAKYKKDRDKRNLKNVEERAALLGETSEEDGTKYYGADTPTVQGRSQSP